jgi:hypothetical protein
VGPCIRRSDGGVLGGGWVFERKAIVRSTAIGAIFMLGAIAAPPGPASANDSAHPTVVELYQSQGCSSCPPAIANINAVAARPDVLALTFAVTYWDQLGWKDTFARPEFTRRQWDFARASGRGNVATPQTIVNGRIVTNGGDRAQLASAIRAADRGGSGPSIRRSGDEVLVGGGAIGRPATIWLVRYDPRLLNVPIRAGENGGRTIAHRNVVRSISAIGRWKGGELAVAMPRLRDPHLSSAILVQSGTGGPIIAAAKL